MRRLVALCALALMVGSVVPARAQDSLTNDETPRQWFVQLSSKPAADGTSKDQLRSEREAFKNAARGRGVQYQERREFDTLFNGFSVEIDPSQLANLNRVPGVTAIYPVIPVAIPETRPTDMPDLATAIGMTGADIAQNELGLTGRGVKVAVMDTGIDIDHPDFGGNGSNHSTSFPTRRIITGYDFVGDAFNADTASPAYNPVAVPDNNPDDCNGHGSHVAGIVGANGQVKGVAPEVQFGAYRVFGCEGSTTSDIMIAAMERALADGMDVLNMSIGSAFQWPQYPTAVAADKLVKKGMVVVASIGNSGANGLFAAGAPGLGENVIGVASFDNTNVTQFAFKISPDGKKIGFNGATASPPAPKSGTAPLARTGTQTSTADACNALPAGSLAGKIALIRRGTCGFYNKALNAQNAGAIGVVLYNNAAGALNPTVAPVAPLTTPITIPVVAITQADGNLIDTRLAGGPVDLTWTNDTISQPNPTAGQISSFSSYGLSPDLALKPDIGAPGGSIWSTYPLEKGGYASLGGTSMASPHVAGAVALLLQARPQTKAADVRDLLQNSADPQKHFAAPTAIENVHRQGAGLLDIDDTVLATSSVTPGKLALGESESGPATRKLTITNKSSAAITYDLSHLAAASTGPNTFTPSFDTTNAASVAFSADSVTVPAGGNKSVNVTITANPNLADRSMYGGYVVLTERETGQVLRVPYAGFKGDYQSIQAMTPTANGFPWLAKLQNGSYVRQTNGATFTLQNGDVPFFLVHFDHQVQHLELEVLSADTLQPVHPVFNNGYEEEYLARNSTATGFFAFTWDGTTIHSNGDKGQTKDVEDGSYVIELKVLKALGDENNPAHWETWRSPVINIDRP